MAWPKEIRQREVRLGGVKVKWSKVDGANTDGNKGNMDDAEMKKIMGQC